MPFCLLQNTIPLIKSLFVPLKKIMHYEKHKKKIDRQARGAGVGQNAFEMWIKAGGRLPGEEAVDPYVLRPTWKNLEKGFSVSLSQVVGYFIFY